MIHVPGQRTNGIRCFGSTGKTPCKETSPKVVFKTDDAATGRGNADGARRVRSKGNVRRSIGSRHCRPA